MQAVAIAPLDEKSHVQLHPVRVRFSQNLKAHEEQIPPLRPSTLRRGRSFGRNAPGTWRKLGMVQTGGFRYPYPLPTVNCSQ